MKTFIVVPAILTLGLATSAALAHHSAAQFDFSIRDRTVSGIVKEFSVANPHTRIVLEVTDEQGTRDIEFEGHSRNNLYRAGWRADMVKVGERVTIGIAPMRDGTDGGYVTSVTTESGQKF
jgi:DNA/RNA endonuclease YhcR with UshA esterase domain